MSADWPRVKVSEVCELIVDCVNKTAPRVQKKTPYKMIRTPNIKNGQVDRAGCRFVEKEIYEKWTRRAKVLRGDILLTREAPMGQVGYVDFDDTVFLGQRIMQYRVNPRVLYSHYLLYAFLSADLQHQFHMHEGSGSVVSHIRVPDCSKFELSLPPIEEQKRVANFLAGLDSKIQLNTQTNQTLEAIAQAIFKSWFVDFDPVKAKIAVLESGGSAEEAELAAMSVISSLSLEALAELKQSNPDRHQQLTQTAALFPSKMQESELGEIPEGWEPTKVESFIELAYGKGLKKSDRTEGEFPVYGSGGIGSFHNQYHVRGPGIIVGRKGTVGSIYWEYRDFFPIDTVFYVKPLDGISLEFAFSLLQTLGLEDMNTDAAVPGLNRNNVYRLEIPRYPNSLIEKFTEIIGKSRDLISSNLIESETLTELRNSLLPKLLSGEIDLSTLNEKASEANA